MNSVLAPVAPPSGSTASRLTAPRSTASRSTSPKKLFQSRSLVATKCISKHAWLRPPISHNHDLQVYLQTRSIMASKCVTKLAQLRPPSAALSSLHHGLPVHIRTRSIMASKCINKLPRLQPPSGSLSSLNHGLPVHLESQLIMASKFAWWWPPSELEYRLEVHLWVHSISASKCISELTRSRSGESAELSQHLKRICEKIRF